MTASTSSPADYLATLPASVQAALERIVRCVAGMDMTERTTSLVFLGEQTEWAQGEFYRIDPDAALALSELLLANIQIVRDFVRITEGI